MKNLYKAQRLELQLANGLDSILESKDREQNLDSLLTLYIQIQKAKSLKKHKINKRKKY